VLYLLVDMRRRQMGVRDLVTLIEVAIIDLLAYYSIAAAAKPSAPGVYVNDEKIAALGLRVRRGCSYHGLALNVAMDLEPFGRINPCGYAGMQVTSMAKQLPAEDIDVDAVGRRLMETVAQALRRNDT
jgi:lipoyl(octanoyl) transferase